MIQIASEFVRAHLGRNAFAPLTGTDWRAWKAFVYLLELWGVSRDSRAVDAMRSTLACAQLSVLDIFIQTIPGVLDWYDVRQLWPSIVPANAADDLAALDIDEDNHVRRAYYGIKQETP